MRRSRGSRVVLVAALAAALALTGCSQVREVATGRPPTTTPAVTAGPTSSLAVVTVHPETGARDVATDEPITARIAQGRVETVVLTDSTGRSVPGSTDPIGSLWTSVGMLRFASTYTLTVTAVDPAGRTTTTTSTFATRASPESGVRARIAPLDGEVVGVGMPVAVYFTEPVSNRAAVQRRLAVTATPAVVGAWSWLSDTEVHWRPREAWPVGTQVTVDVALDGVPAGDGRYGDQDRQISFSIGAHAIESTIDFAAQSMSVKQDGVVVRRMPIVPTRRLGWEIRSGTTVVLSKERTRVLDGADAGVPVGSPEHYRFQAAYALGLTWTGEFIHEAPDEGSAQVARGSIGLLPADAAWIYSVSSRGDLVTVVNSGRTIEPLSGYTDWNVDWDTWLAGSAL